MQADQIKAGNCYSNGDFGRRWTVWNVLEIDPESETVRYKILVGENRRKTRTVPMEEFASKVRYEVVLVENSWQRAG